MNNQFSQRVSNILLYSKEEAYRLKNKEILPEHLMLGMIRDGGGTAIEILRHLDVDMYQLRIRMEFALRDGSQTEGQVAIDDIPLSKLSTCILKMCMLEARLTHSSMVDTEHLLLALLKESTNKVGDELNDMGIQYNAIYKELKYRQSGSSAEIASSRHGEDEEEEEDEDGFPSYSDSRSDGQEHASQATAQKSTTTKSANDTPVLDKFGIDMTRIAAENRLDPVVGRNREIERVAQILSRRKKNNPVLIGEPGVGKSAIVEGLALRIVQKKVSRILFDKRVIMLDMSSVVAGTKFRGQFEERMQSIINELQKNPNIILFIDEVHTIVGAGSAAGTMDAANILKPALARGDIQCIGATTLSEYHKSIEKDGALERRFQKVLVEQTTEEETLEILHNIKEKYEQHHHVCYTDEALVACVKLTGRYISDRSFPDKAIDAMDEAGSRSRMSHISVPKELEEQERLLAEARKMKTSAVKSQNYELAASYRDREKALEYRLEEMKNEWEQQQQERPQTVDAEQIAEVVSMMSGIPVQRIAQSEGAKLAGMKAQLQSEVVAQDAAIEKLTKAIIRSRVGLKDPNHPIGTFLFLGPTGVGKTYLAKQLAKHMFGSEDALIRIDMSEFVDRYTVSRLVGTTPGYIGYEEGGQLTEKVRRKPYSILLFDEIEKAHPDVFSIFLQVMDEGRLTDGSGRTVDFKNTVIIMTSNIGTRQLKEFGRGVGFASQQRTLDKEFSQSVIQKALHKQFAPEFLNRIDEIITFDQLSPEAIERIVDLEVGKLGKRLEGMGYQLKVTPEAKHFLASKGYDVQFGARPLKRAIQSYLEDSLSEQLVEGRIQLGDTLQASMNEQQDAIQIQSE